jgi:glycosyltransferase involved in cell wall biosynthesis
MTDIRVRLLCGGRDLRGGGAERVQLSLLQHLDRSRFDIRLFYLSNREELHGLIPPDISPVFGVSGNHNLKHRAVPLLACLVKLARQSDVVFAMQEGTPIYLATLASRLARRPVVVWVHNLWSKALRQLRSWHGWASMLFLLCDGVVGVSQGVTNDLTEHYPRLRGRVIVLPNPIPSQRILAQAQAPLPTWAHQIFAKRTLLAAGRLTFLKGFDVLMLAFAELVREGADLHLLILGEGEERSRLEHMAKELGVFGRVFMPGFQANPYPFFKRAEVFVLSSRWEGLGIVLLEAAILGLPVISTDCPGGPPRSFERGPMCRSGTAQ